MAKFPKQSPNQGFINELNKGGSKDANAKPTFTWAKDVVKQVPEQHTKPQMNRQTSPKASKSSLVKEQQTYIKNRQGK